MRSTLDLSFLRSRTAMKRIAAVTTACALLGALYGLLAPKWYRSVLTVVPRTSQKSGLSSVLGSMGGLAAGLDPGLGGAAETPRIAAVLQSIAVTDGAIEALDLRTRYGEKLQENARDALWDHCEVKTLTKANLVELSCEDKDPRFAQQLVSSMAERGNEVFRRVSVSSASEEVRFLAKRIAELRQQADDSGARMREFQEKHRIVDLDTQAKAVVSAMAALNGQRITKQLELDYARTFSSGDEASTQQLQSQLRVMREKLRDLEEPDVTTPEPDEKRAQRAGEGRTGLFPAALAVPKLRAEFEKLYRDRKVAETTLVFALERLETAQANEARDVSTFLVLDPPTLPTRRSRPKRAASILLGALLGLAGSLLLEWRRIGGVSALFAGRRTAGAITSGESRPAAANSISPR